MTCHLHLPSTPREQLSHVHRDVWFLPVVLELGRAEAEGCCELQASLSNRESPWECAGVSMDGVCEHVCVCMWEGCYFTLLRRTLRFLLCHPPPDSLETGSPTEPGAKQVTCEPQPSSGLRPPVLGLQVCSAMASSPQGY